MRAHIITVASMVLAATLSVAQRPSFAGIRPIGYPEIGNAFQDESLNNRFSDEERSKFDVGFVRDKYLEAYLNKLKPEEQPEWYKEQIKGNKQTTNQVLQPTSGQQQQTPINVQPQPQDETNKEQQLPTDQQSQPEFGKPTIVQHNPTSYLHPTVVQQQPGTNQYQQIPFYQQHPILNQAIPWWVSQNSVLPSEAVQFNSGPNDNHISWQPFGSRFGNPITSNNPYGESWGNIHLNRLPSWYADAFGVPY